MDLKIESHRLIRQIEKKIQEDLSVTPAEGETLNPTHLVSDFIKEILTDKPDDIRRRVISEFESWGPIEILLENSNVTEILINSPEEIWFEDSGRLKKYFDAFATNITFHNFLERLYQKTGHRPTAEHPYADGNLGGHRVHVLGSELTSENPVVSIRRHPENPWTLQKLEEHSCFTAEQGQILREKLHEKKNIFFIGPTSSGKTSLLNSCLNEIDDLERVLTIEDCKELRLKSKLGIQLYARRDFNNSLPEVDQSELLRQALRMRPDRLVVGEVRGGEAKDLLLALSTGHAGSMGSMHAHDAHQALMRLEFLVQMGAPEWSILTIRKLISCTVQVIVVLGREAGQRKVKGIYETTSLEESGILLERLA